MPRHTSAKTKVLGNKTEKTAIKKTHDELLAEAIARIESLQITRRYLARLANRPLSMSVSIVVFPTLITLLFLKEKSPFRWIYDEIYKNFYFETYETPGLEVLDQLTNADIEIENAFNSLKEKINEAGENPLIQLIAQKKLDFEEVVKIYEQFNHETADFQDLKQNLIRILNYYIQVYPRNSKKELLSENNLDHHSLLQLFHLIDEHIKFSKHHIYKAILPDFRKLTVAMATNLYMNKGVLFTKIFLTMAAQYLVVDPLIDRLFPYGVMVAKPPIPQTWLTLKQATKLVAEMEEYQLALNKRANLSNSLALGASFLIIPLALFLMSQEEPSPELIVFTLTLVATAGQIFAKNITHFYQAKVAHRQFKQQEAFLNQALKDFEYKKEIFSTRDIDSSYFSISFASIQHGNNQLLSGKTIAHIFKNCCEYYQIQTQSQRGNFLKIPGKNSLNAEIAALLNSFFTESIAREIKNRQLTEQIKSLLKIIISNEYALVKIPGVDEKNLPITTFIIRLKKDLDARIIEKLKITLSHCQFVCEELQSCCEITITGMEPLRFKVYDEALNELTHLVQEIRLKYLELTQKEEKSKKPHQISDKKNIAFELNDTKDNDEKLAKEKARVIKWSSGNYDSDDQHNKVYPIIFGRVHDNRAYENARFFITNKLNYDKALEDLDRSVRDDVEKKIDELVPKIRFKSAKGEQALVPWRSIELNQDGEKFQTSAKGKILGEFGKIRFFTRSEISPTGENLLVVEGVDLVHCAKIKKPP